MNEYLDFAKDIAYKAGDAMMKYFRPDISYHTKFDNNVINIVTAADEEINALVIKEVEKRFPGHAVFGEEASLMKDSDYAWVLDPVDGTVPYAKGIPIAVFSLALVKNGEPIVGVVYDPFMKRLYSAEKGGGAFINDKPIKVSSQGLNSQATVNIEWWPEAEFDVDTAGHKLSLEKGAYVLHLGCAVQAACLVASGKYEASIYAGTKGKNVDIAAVKIIVEEAGGKVTSLNDDEQRYDRDIAGAIISNGVTHEELVKYFKQKEKEV